MTDLNKAVEIPDDVLVRIVDGEAVLLNLDNETYYGLDDVSTDFWAAITESNTLADAVERLQGEFDVDAETLRTDFGAFISELVDAGLVSLTEPVNA